MKRYLAVGIIVAGLLLCASLCVSKLRSVSAQTNQNPTQTSPTPLRPNEGAIIGVLRAERVLAGDINGDGIHDLVATTGGTGFGPRDLTPEGTRAVLDREAAGLAEAMRLANPDKGRLSRGVAGIVGRCIVLNTPGSTAGAVECLDAVLDVLPHALALPADAPTDH